METYFMALMVLVSVVGLTFIVERGIVLRWNAVIPRAIETALDSARGAAGRAAVHAACEQHPSPLARLLLAAEDHLDLPKDENENALQSRARQEVVQLERGLVILEIIVGIAPLMGLVGTIYGMITLFGGLGEAGADNVALAHGVSWILRFTMMGLLIAIPSIIAWSYYSKKVEMLAVEMENLCSEFLRRQYHEAATK